MKDSIFISLSTLSFNSLVLFFFSLFLKCVCSTFSFSLLYPKILMTILIFFIPQFNPHSDFLILLFMHILYLSNFPLSSLILSHCSICLILFSCKRILNLAAVETNFLLFLFYLNCKFLCTVASIAVLDVALITVKSSMTC